MRQKPIFLMALLLILIVGPLVPFGVSDVKAPGAICIWADGSIDPATAPISTEDNFTYVFTADINNQSLFVQRSNITINGREHLLQGSHINFSYGICLSNVSNVKVENTRIEAFTYGIFVDSGSNHKIIENAISNTVDAVFLQSSANDSISGNSIATNSGWGVVFFDSHNETLTGNNITGNHGGVWLAPSSNNEISENNIANNTGDGIALYSVYYNGTFNSSSSNNINRNNITGNGVDGIKLLANSNHNTIVANNLIENQLAIELNYSTGNTIYHNFMSNAQQALSTFHIMNNWDDSYPSGGNYWSDYTGVDFCTGVFQNQTGSDGIGDSQHAPTFRSVDRYPLSGMFNSFNVSWVDSGYSVDLVSNSTISGFDVGVWIEHPEDPNTRIICFNVTGEDGTTGFCRILIPAALMNGSYAVFVNGLEIVSNLLPGSNSTRSYLYFNYTHPTQEVTIIPEFPSFLLLPLIFAVTSRVVIAYKRKHR